MNLANLPPFGLSELEAFLRWWLSSFICTGLPPAMTDSALGLTTRSLGGDGRVHRLHASGVDVIHDIDGLVICGGTGEC